MKVTEGTTGRFCVAAPALAWVLFELVLALAVRALPLAWHLPRNLSVWLNERG